MKTAALSAFFAVAALGTFLALQGAPGSGKAAHAPGSPEGATPGHAPPELGQADSRGGSPHGAHGSISRSAIAALPMTAPVVVVNEVTFTRADLERAISQHAVVSGIPPASLDAQTRDALEAPAYEKLIERQLLGGEARRRGFWPTDEEVTKERDKLAATLPPGKTLAEALKTMGSDEKTFVVDLASDVAISRLFEAMKNEQKVPDEARLKQIYEENKAKFVVPDTAQASHVLIRVAKDAKPEEVKAALEKAKAIRAEVQGKDAAAFKAVASEKSEDPSARTNGGDLGMFAKGDMVPAFEAAAFQLKEGEISEPVRSDFGFHVIRGGGVKKGGQKTYAEMKQMIADREGVRGFMEKIDGMIDELRKNAKITRVQEPMPSPFAPDDGKGTRVPAWKPGSKNAAPGASPHGGVSPHGGQPG